MTPQEYEWAVEQTELAYERKQIGKISFLRRMSRLGLNDVTRLREWMNEIDQPREQKHSSR